MPEQSEYQTLGVIRKGKLQVFHRASFDLAMSRFVDGLVSVTVQTTTEKAQRSLQANKYMWVLFTMIGEETGHTRDEIHDLMCQRFLSYQLDTVDRQTGEITSTQVTRGTSRLTSKEHAAFLDQVIQWMGEFLGMTVPSMVA